MYYIDAMIIRLLVITEDKAMINGSIQEKKGNLYAVLSIPTTGGRYKQKWVSMGMKSTAGKRKQKERLDEIRQEYSSIICLEATEILFCDYIKKWNEETKADKSITTYDGYCHMINKYVYPYFLERKLTLDKIDTMDIDCYYQWLQTQCGLSGNTALKHHQIIYTSLKYAVYNRLIRDNPAERVKRPKTVKPQHNFYDVNELTHLMEIVKNDPLESVIYLTIWLGVRRSEILGLKWCNVDFAKHTILICETAVRGKQNGKVVRVEKEKTKSETSNRVLRMSKEMEEYLHSIRQHQMQQQILCGKCYNFNDYICVDDMGEPIKPDYVSHRFKEIIKKNELRHITFHDLRHSTASYYLSKGYSLKDIQELLGHSSYAFTADTYAHVDTSTKQEMADAITRELKAL